MAVNTRAEVNEVRGPWRDEFVECAACAYEPPRFVPRMRCPKCFGFRTFHRVKCSRPQPLHHSERASPAAGVKCGCQA
jgi:hypothetical protein